MNRDNRRLRLVFALLVVTSLTLLTADLRGGKGGAFGAVRSAVGSVFGPVEDGISDVVNPIGRSLSAAADSGADQRKIDQLQKQITQLQIQRDRDALLKEVTPEAQKLGIFEGLTKTSGVFAKVIGHGDPVDDYAQTITIDVGTRDSVAVGMPVVASSPTTDGLIGLVVHADLRTSIVSLMTDPKFAVGVDVTSGDSLVAQATGQGAGQPLAYTQIVPANQQKAGTPLVTAEDSSLDRGIPVGTLSATRAAQGGTQQQGTVTPYVDGETATIVDVLLSQDRNSPRAPLNPQPSPSASPSTAPGTAATPSGKPSGTATAGPRATPSAGTNASGATTP